MTEEINATNERILAETHFGVSEFLKTFSPLFKQQLLGESRQRPFSRLGLCEIMTILVAYQIIGAPNFKHFYKEIIWQYHHKEFPNLVSYSHFIAIAPIAVIPLVFYLQFRMEMSQQTGLYVIDSTPLRVCMNLRIPRHQVFKEMAGRGKSSTGWFYGFKLHLVINHLGELMNVYISAGNYDDRKSVMKLVQKLKGKLLGDKGYIKKALLKKLMEQGLQLITTLKKNMKPQQRALIDRLLLRKRALVETTNDLLKNHFQVEHSRHRSLTGFMNNILAALIAYTFYPVKPKMRGVDYADGLAIETL